ncbi:DNA repair protein RecO [bacterium]|nr:DNA repair protein RecO [bacterium]
MSVVSTEAFVLRTYKLAEQDKIVVLFTKEMGKVRLVAKGARKLKNRFGAALELLTRVRILFHNKPNRELQVLDRAELLYSPMEKQPSLRFSYYLFYFAELINDFYPDHEKNFTAFRILSNIEHALVNNQNLDFLARYVELQLLHSQGVLSSVAFCSQCNRKFESLQERRYLAAGTEVFCTKCRKEDSIFLSSALVKSIHAFERGSTEWVTTLRGPVLEDLGTLNHLLITRFLGKELQSYRLRKHLL